VRLQRERAVRRVEHGDVAAGGEHAIVLVHLGAPVARRQMLDHPDSEHEIEGPVGVGQPLRLVVTEEARVDDLLQVAVLDLGMQHGDEVGVRVERRDTRHFRLLVEILGDVAERAADLEHGEPAGPARPEIREERGQEVPSAGLLEREVEDRPAGALALDEHADHTGAVAGDVILTAHGEHAPVAEIPKPILRLGHRA
jgi:hypothetical protein